MKHLYQMVTVFCAALMAVLILTGCEGAELYGINSPDWRNDRIDSIANSKKTTLVSVTPNPTVLGTDDNTTPFWTVFTDDIKAEPGMAYQVKFINYGGANNWNNFLIILRNEAKDVEYGVLRSDNWGWGTKYTSDEQDFYYTRKTEDNRDWGAWLKAMSMAKCTATIANKGDGTADVKIVMIGSDGVTYTQDYTDIIGIDKDNLYFSFTVDGSHMEFGDIDIEDSEPVLMTLIGVPAEVLIDTPLEEAMADVRATITYANGATKDITADELQFEAIPNYSELGQKTLVAIYNKTYLGNASEKAVIASKDFAVVSEYSAYTQTYLLPNPIVLGKEDNTSTPWYESNTNHYKIEPKETKVVSFTNYTAGVNNWDNFLIRLTNEAWASYCVVRADDFGWDAGYAACTHTYEADRDWAGWLPAMNGAKVTAYITNNGDGTADIKIVMAGVNGITYTQNYIGINTINPDDLWVDFCVENSHIVFESMLGAKDNTTPFWGAHTANVKVSANQVYTVSFTNYGDGATWWDNFYVVLNHEDLNLGAAGEYGVLRADNFGWGTGYGACSPATEADRNWDAWAAAMNGAKVTVKVANKGNGTADVMCTILGSDGNTYKQDYIGINTIDPNDFYFRLTVEKAHLVFE